jgi:ribosomal protein S6
MAGFYDLMLLIDPNAPEERRTAAINEAESLIGAGGALAGSYDWGQRRMAYEIDHRPGPTIGCTSSRATTSCSSA